MTAHQVITLASVALITFALLFSGLPFALADPIPTLVPTEDAYARVELHYSAENQRSHTVPADWQNLQ